MCILTIGAETHVPIAAWTVDIRASNLCVGKYDVSSGLAGEEIYPERLTAGDER